MFGPSRVSLVFLLLITVTIIQPGDAFVSRSITARKEVSHISYRLSSTTRPPAPALASHSTTTDPSARKLWPKLSLSFWKRVIRKRATRFLIVFYLVMGLWRTPPTSRALDEIASTSMETIGDERIVMQPLEIPSKKIVDPKKKKSLIIAIGVSGATFTAVRPKKRHSSEKRDGTNINKDSEEPQNPNESNLVSENPFLEGTSSSPSLSSSLAVDPISASTETDTSPDGHDNPDDSRTTTEIKPPVIEETIATAGKLQLDDVTRKEEVNQVVSIAKEREVQQKQAVNPLRDPPLVGSSQQPKSQSEEEMLKTKYGQIDDVSERAYQILIDLGMVEASNPLEKTPFEGS